MILPGGSMAWISGAWIKLEVKTGTFNAAAICFLERSEETAACHDRLDAFGFQLLRCHRERLPKARIRMIAHDLGRVQRTVL